MCRQTMCAAVTAFLLLCASGCDRKELSNAASELNGESPVAAELSGSGTRIIVTSKADQLMIEDVVLNRGNCKLDQHRIPEAYRTRQMPMLPVTLRFGEVFSDSFECESRLIEAEIKTNLGAYTFHWD